MGQSYPNETGLRVEAFEPSEAVTTHRPMLYSAEALKTIEAIREQLGRMLKQKALDLTRRDDRKLVTDDDVWAAIETLGMTDIYAGSDEVAGDGG